MFTKMKVCCYNAASSAGTFKLATSRAFWAPLLRMGGSTTEMAPRRDLSAGRARTKVVISSGRSDFRCELATRNPSVHFGNECGKSPPLEISKKGITSIAASQSARRMAGQTA